MYICLECGEIFEDFTTWTEPHGEQLCGCPYCKGAYEEAFKCEKCGEYFFEDEMHGSMCDSCIDNYKYNIDVCYEIGAEDTEEIKINCFLTAMFDMAEIEAILYNHLKSADKYIDCLPFIDNDRSWFADKILKKEVLGNENSKG